MGSGDGGMDAVDAPTAPTNLMFVTSGTKPGLQLATAAQADEHCHTAASAAGLSGSYVAWVSFQGGVSAASRLGTKRGWRRRDGEPFADTFADLVAGKMYAPPRIDENGNDAWSEFERVVTGTGMNGQATGFDCSSANNATFGVMDASSQLWTEISNLDCNIAFHVYCFGTDYSEPLVVPKRTPVAFLSTPVAIKGSAELFDAHCNADAAAKLPGMFRAAVATTGESGIDRVRSSADTRWYRVDGTPVATSAGTGFLAPLDVTADGTHVVANVFYGSPFLTSSADTSNNCQDWTATSGMTRGGDSRRSSNGAFEGSTDVQCASMQRVYCFQVN